MVNYIFVVIHDFDLLEVLLTFGNIQLAMDCVKDVANYQDVNEEVKIFWSLHNISSILT